MYKKILSVLSLIAIFSSCKKDDGGDVGGTTGGPQITATAFINNHTAGSKPNGYTLDSGIIKMPTASTNLVLDYSTVTQGANWADTLKAPNNPTSFPNATYMRGVNQQIIGQTIALNQYYQLSANSWTNLGNYIGTPVNIAIPTIGAINLPVQAAKQNPAIVLANFPIVYNDSFNVNSINAITSNVTATTTVSGFPITLNNEPLTTTLTSTIKSKNIAYGTLQLKGYTGTMQVVIQKYTFTEKTNFAFANSLYNLALNSILSTNFGITNDQTITYSTYRFWAVDKGLVMTLNNNGIAYVTLGL